MSWFSRSFSMNENRGKEEQRAADEEEEEEDDDDEEEEEEEGLDLAAIASATGKGVKEDLSQLTKTFTRQLWGVASFLAPPPVERERSSSGERLDVSSSSSSQQEGFTRRENEATSRDTSGDREGFVAKSDNEVSAGDRTVSSTLAEEISGLRVMSSPLKFVEQSSAPTTPRGGPRLTGLRSDFAELRGSVATGLSRISSSVIRVVSGDNSGDDEEEELESNSSSAAAGNVRTPRSSEGVDQGSKSSSRGLDSFLKPLLGNMLAREGSDKGDASSEDEDEGPTTNKVQYEVNAKAKGSDTLPSAFASGIDGISKFLLHIVQDEEYDEKDDESDERLDAVGLTEAVVTFARNIAMHPETWLDFPLPEDENDDDFVMNITQKQHAHALELAAPGLKALRIELCPNYMSDGRFWLNYFVLLHSRLNPEEAQLLSTSQVLSARASLLRELQKRDGVTGDQDLSKDHDRTRELLHGDIERNKLEPQSSRDNAEDEIKSRPSESKGPVVTDKGLSDVRVSLPSSGQETKSLAQNVEEADPVISARKEAIGQILAVERNVEAGSKRFPMLNLEDDEAEVDEWLDDEPSTNKQALVGGQSLTDLGNMDEDVSFSDFEDDEPTQSADGSKESGASAKSTTTPGANKVGTSSAREEKGDGAQLRNSEKGDFNDWLTVDNEDAVSASSSP